MDTKEIIILCLTIFVARISDVTIGTIRTIFVVNGRKFIAAALGFAEVLIWFTVVREALNTESNNIFIPLAYAAGFACGNLLGGYVSEKVIKDKYSVKVITTDLSMVLIDTLRENNYAVTVSECFGRNNTPKWMLYLEIQDSRLKELKKLIYSVDEHAFVSVNKSKAVYKGFFGLVK